MGRTNPDAKTVVLLPFQKTACTDDDVRAILGEEITVEILDFDISFDDEPSGPLDAPKSPFSSADSPLSLASSPLPLASSPLPPARNPLPLASSPLPPASSPLPGQLAESSLLRNHSFHKAVTKDNLIFYDSREAASVLGGLKTPDDVLYIKGHCGADLDFLQSDDGKQRIKTKSLADFLAGGASKIPRLSKGFTGKIKVYACSSGASESFLGNSSFAQEFADDMWVAGYRHCRFFGYTENLMFFRKEGPEGLHRYAAGIKRRAKEVRKEFHPTASARLSAGLGF